MYQPNDIKHFTITLTVLALSFIPLISAHVALTYPPARKYDLDFLDNTRTKGPCGMPKGEHLISMKLTLLTPSFNEIYLFIC